MANASPLSNKLQNKKAEQKLRHVIKGKWKQNDNKNIKIAHFSNLELPLQNLHFKSLKPHAITKTVLASVHAPRTINRKNIC